ncbi:metal-dependent phosphohydrolase [Sporolactobacillus shoreae]|uniref:Metal-dependent phosphohydrolase n=1 Tax=Sporolactobacillus shoreae TaxID=1465501 RepID=A0A4Z0GNW1_9BACL|nr:HD domain-containing phosphohydrolase [Sporolactobacillus shoreae]TGA98645.1 metal-dependent phosphohydrolase [Sporolactobacillus shoreae]
MQLAVQSLKPGYVLKKDVHVKAVRPLIKSGTILNETHLAFLKAFLIKEVEIESVRADGHRIKAQPSVHPDEHSDHGIRLEVESGPVNSVYQQAVDAYKIFFEHWQSGASLNIGEFRKEMMPILEESLNDPIWMTDFLLKKTMVRSRADRNITLGLLSGFLGKKMNFSQGDVYQIGLAGMLADCGMAKLPPSLMNKDGNYVGSERALYEKHVLDSYKMVKSVPTLKEDTMLAVIQHHEREDGSGFPLHLTGDRLSLFGKILAICDCFLHNATKSSEARWPIEVLDRIREKYYGKLSNYLLDKFCNELMTLFIGMDVILSNNLTGTIVFIPEKNPTKPVIRLENNEIFSQASNRAIQITRIYNRAATK